MIVVPVKYNIKYIVKKECSSMSVWLYIIVPVYTVKRKFTHLF